MQVKTCYMCGQQITKNDKDPTPDSKGNLWCEKCVIQALDRWTEFETIDQIAGTAKPVRDGLVEAIKLLVEDNFCSEPRLFCKRTGWECVKCWFKKLTGETLVEEE